MNKKNIALLSSEITKKSILGSLSFLAISMGMLGCYFVVKQTQQDHQKLVEAVSGNIQLASQLGDQFQLKKLSYSLLSSGAFDGIDMRIGDKLVLQEGTLLDNNKLLTQPSGIHFLFPAVTDIQSKVIEIGLGAQPLVLTTAKSVPPRATSRTDP